MILILKRDASYGFPLGSYASILKKMTCFPEGEHAVTRKNHKKPPKEYPALPAGLYAWHRQFQIAA
jgi:hypothetical protein